MESKRPSRVMTLRDLFQSGKPIPAEDLEELSNAPRPRANTEPVDSSRIPTKYYTKCGDEMKMEPVVVTNNDLLPQLNNADGGDGSGMNNSVWVVKKHRASSSDNDSNQSDPTHRPESVSPTPKTNYSREFNLSLLVTAPFQGNQSPKIRPLGEEFRARRMSNQSLRNSDGLFDDKKQVVAPAVTLVESRSFDGFVGSFNEKLTPSVAISDNAKKDDSDSDIDGDNNNFSNVVINEPTISEQQLHEEPVEQVDHKDYEHLIDNYSAEFMAIYSNTDDEKQQPNVNVTFHQVVENAPRIRTTQPEEQHCDTDHEFQDYILDSLDNNGNGIASRLLNTEDLMDIDEGQTSSDEELEVNNKSVTGQPMTDDSTNKSGELITHEMICPSSKKILFVEADGCHVLEDGNFFYEKAVEIDVMDTESYLEECLVAHNDDESSVKSYRRPGAQVHFFLDKVRIYSTHAVDEYNRKNDDIDPLSSSAEYEMEKRLEKMEIFPVDLYKGNKGLGISILGLGVGHTVGLQKLGIFVKSVFPGGAAEEDGRIKIYDQIVEVNGQSLVCVSQEFAASVLRNTHGVVHFMIGREIDQKNSEIVKLVERSRQNSGLPPPTDSHDAPIVKMEEVVPKPFAESESPDIPKQGTKETKFEYENSAESPSSSTVPQFDTICTQTDMVCNVSNAQEKAFNDTITNLKNQLEQSRANEEKLFKTVFELKDKVDEVPIIRSELEILTKAYNELDRDFKNSQIELDKSQIIMDELQEENRLLQEKLDETTKKYKKLKRFFKANELREQKSVDSEQHNKLLTSYEAKVKHLEAQVEMLQRKGSENDVPHGSVSVPHVYSMNDIYASKSNNVGNLNSSSSSDVEEEKNILDAHINSSDVKSAFGINQNFSNPYQPPAADIFADLIITDSRLDNTAARNKAELRKPNRKPPTKSLSSEDDLLDVNVCNSSNTNKVVENESHLQLMSTNCTESSKADNYAKDREKPVSFEKDTNIKVIGGFALPGTSEIKSATKSRTALAKKSKPGIKPSNILNARKTAKISDQPSEKEKQKIFSSLKSKEAISKEKDKVVLTSARPIANDAILDKPHLNIFSHDYLPNDVSKGDSYKLKIQTDLPSQESVNIPVSKWDQDNVSQWLQSVDLQNLETALFSNGITTGYKLIRLDSDSIKKIAVLTSQDRYNLKRRIKELRQLNSSVIAKSPNVTSSPNTNGKSSHH